MEAETRTRTVDRVGSQGLCDAGHGVAPFNGTVLELVVYFKNQSALPVNRHTANRPG